MRNNIYHVPPNSKKHHVYSNTLTSSDKYISFCYEYISICTNSPIAFAADDVTSPPRSLSQYNREHYY